VKRGDRMLNRKLAGLVGAVVLLSAGAPAVTAGDPDLPIAFTNAVPDICFAVANGHALTQHAASAYLLEPLDRAPASINGIYGKVPNWYRSSRKPRNIFIGVGDAPGRCHIVLADTTDGRAAFRHLAGVLGAAGFIRHEDRSGKAITLFVKRSASGNMLVLLKGLTDAVDGAGPQVSVDVSTAPDSILAVLLAGK
jgi:hypothetical protein